ncbi:MAG: M24 family metallopeptidase, partial [Actinomycetes bacterium]
SLPDGPVVLTSPAAVAWVTGGGLPPVDRTSTVDPVWAVVDEAGAVLITSEVEADRVREDLLVHLVGFDLVAVPWYEPTAMIIEAERYTSRPAGALPSDGHPGFGLDVREELTALRLVLSAPEQDELVDLGSLAADALQRALTAWRPGERDLDIQARIAHGLESVGAEAPVLIVGVDDRVSRYRHPMAIGARGSRLVMGVVVARRAGLHVATTRMAAHGRLSEHLRRDLQLVRGIEQEVLRACRPGATYGSVLATLAGAYRTAGHDGAWRQHYQGGPIGYAQREFEIAPEDRTSRWASLLVAPGVGVAWNPSLPQGAKVEDTYLVEAAGLRLVSSAPGWPAEPGYDDEGTYPGVLDITTGTAA